MCVKSFLKTLGVQYCKEHVLKFIYEDKDNDEKKEE